jgi:hydroxypyruvate isomerase
VDHKGYFLTRTDQTMTILEAVNSPNVKMLFDIYHQQITEGNVIRNITKNIDRIGHFHVADNPGRKEPGTGELNYKNIFKAIATTNYKDFVALECGHSTKNYEDTLKATLACLDFA